MPLGREVALAAPARRAIMAFNYEEFTAIAASRDGSGWWA
jgi:hypothetical protein